MVFSQTDGFRLRTNTGTVSFVTVSPFTPRSCEKIGFAAGLLEDG